MKLSRLSNRQLRRLLARGEVRFADDLIEKALKKVDFNIGPFAVNPHYLRDVEKAIPVLEQAGYRILAKYAKECIALAKKMDIAVNNVNKEIDRISSLK